MRKLLAFLFVIGAAISASAECLFQGIFCVSDDPTLNKDGIIILRFHANSQVLVKDLNRKYPIYLVSKSGNVNLNVTETLKGEMWETEIVLKPASELIPGQVYTLQIDYLPKTEFMPERYNRKEGKWESLSFRVADFVDNSVPVQLSEPAEQEKVWFQFGCGPDKQVYFKISDPADSGYFVRTVVRNKSTGHTTTYILVMDKGKVVVGHGMCGGAFHFDNGDNFEVSFQLMDKSGNMGASTRVIAFKPPDAPTDRRVGKKVKVG